MKNISKTIFKIGFLALTLTSVGCATSIVKKPAADMVKSVAVVSVYSNTGVYNMSGESATEKAAGWANTFGISGNKSKGKDNAAAKLVDFGGTRVLILGITPDQHWHLFGCGSQQLTCRGQIVFGDINQIIVRANTTIVGF